MSFLPDRDSRFAQAEAALADYLARREGGEPLEFERFCAEHDEIAAELQLLFRTCESLDRPPHQDSFAGLVGLPESLARAHNRFADYQVGERIARGGMGEIVAVHDPVLRRDMVMKIVRGDDWRACDERARRVERFLREARTTGQLDHPGIVPVHELGVHSDGRPYFTMKRVRGQTLADLFAQHRKGDIDWSQARLLIVLQRVCEATAYAHSRGAIHRDLKPANVMVGDFGEVYVMDWGLSKLRDDAGQPETSSVGASSSGDSLATMEGEVIGTPCYMSPEQAAGAQNHVGPATDVYAIGAMLYELICGSPPYCVEGRAPPPHAVLARLLRGPPAPLEHCAPRTPAELLAICDKAMRRDPRQRFVDARDLASDLAAFAEDRVVRAHRTGPIVELRKWIRRNRALTASAAMALLAVLVGSVWIARANRDLAGALQSQVETARFGAYRSNLLLAQAELEAGNDERAAYWLGECPERERGWEWRHLALRPLSNDRRVALSMEASALAFDRGGTRLAVGGREGDVLVLRSSDFDVLSAFRVPPTDNVDWVADLAFDPTGGILAVATKGAIPTLWRVDDGGYVGALVGHRSEVVDLSFGLDPDVLYTAAADGSIRAWSVSQQRELSRLDFDAALPTSLAIDPAGERMLAGFSDGAILEWELGSWCVTTRLEFPGESVAQVRYDPKGQLLMASSNQPSADRGITRLWMARTHELWKELRSDGVVLGSQVDVDAGLVCVASSSGDVAVLSIDSEDAIDQIGLVASGLRHRKPTAFCAADFAPAALGDLHMTSGHGLLARSGFTRRTSDFHFESSGNDRMQFSRRHPSEPRLAIATDSTITLLDSRTGRHVATLEQHEETVNCVAFTRDGRRMLSVDDNGRLVEWDARDYRVLRKRELGASVLAVCGSDASDVIVFQREDLGIGVLIGDDPAPRWTLAPSELPGEVFKPLVTRDGRRVFAATGERTVTEFDARDGRPLRTLLAPTRLIGVLALSPDEQFVAAGCDDFSVVVWSLVRGNVERRLLFGAYSSTEFLQTPVVTSLEFDATSSRLFAGLGIGVFCAWDLPRGELLLCAPALRGWITGLDVDPVGGRVWLTNHRGELRVLESDPRVAAEFARGMRMEILAGRWRKRE
ncbi:MAG: protein kinase [Planctomycetes bacterium]|nr:protein kinase [Planctomycetota bacterium]